MKSKRQSRDKSNILASRDKHSVVHSFQASLKEDLKLSKQRSSKVQQHEGDRVLLKSTTIVTTIDADKLAKDAGGRYIYVVFAAWLLFEMLVQSQGTKYSRHS